MMQVIRPAAVAGSFYPSDPDELRSMIKRLLRENKSSVVARPKALIVPHAGYECSGPVAATAYAQLAPYAHSINNVLLVGPAHHVGFRGLAISDANLFETPLGRVEVDETEVEHLLTLPQVRVFGKAHQAEHSLEVQLPFLQYLLADGFRITPLVVGDAKPQAIAEVIERFWYRRDELIVVSSDLSHYHDYETAHRMDKLASRWIEQREVEKLQPEYACGFSAIQGLLSCARDHDASVKTIDLRNSGDTGGPRQEVVGYGAYMVHQ